MFRKLLDQGEAGDSVGYAAAASSARTSGMAGMSPSPAPPRRTPSSKAGVYILSKDEGGRHAPFWLTTTVPQFYFRTDVTSYW